MNLIDAGGGNNFADQLFGYQYTSSGNSTSYNETRLHSGYGGGYDPYDGLISSLHIEIVLASGIYSFCCFGGFETP